MTVKAMEVIRQLLAAGETVTEDKIAERAGVAAGTANKAWSQFRATREAAEQATAEANEKARDDRLLEKAETAFSAKSKLKVEDAIRIHKKRLDKAFMQTVHEEVRRQIVAADDSTRRQLAELMQQERLLRAELGKRGIFTPQEYRQLQILCHPDSSASPQVKARLLDLVVRNKVRLLKEE
jgi:hypothetical protein